jgi:nitrite reductase/ring-hydroxylating ferredoxin subunit
MGIGLAMGGATLASVGGYLGGHLIGALGVGVDHNAFEGTVADWTPCCDLASLSERPTRVQVKPDDAVLLVRRGDTALAVSAICPHRGAPLDEGEVEGDVVTCPWHGSQFSLVDGSVQAGPSPAPIRSYDVRVTDGVVELRDHHD